MAFNEEFGRWRVKITSLPTSITVDQLSELLHRHPSRICIPKRQMLETYHAWINNFDNERDANDFVRQYSRLTISNIPIKCVAVPSTKDNANDQCPPPWNPALVSMNTCQTSNNQFYQNQIPNMPNRYYLQPQPQQFGNAREREMPPVQAQTQNSDLEYERTLCPYANKGACRYKDGECKYLHKKCQNYNSCSQSYCRLAHATSADRKIQSKLRLCLSSNRCYNDNCTYEHPEGWSACADGIQCKNYDCDANHPPGRTQRCPNGDLCRNRPSCSYLHPIKHSGPSTPIGRMPPVAVIKPNIVSPMMKKQLPEIIELSGAQYNFLQYYGDKIVDAMRKKPGIINVTVKDGNLQLTGERSTIAILRSHIKETLYEQNVKITSIMKKYLESNGKPSLLRQFLQKYSVGISFPQPSTNTSRESRACDSDEDDDDDDVKSDISNMSSNRATNSGFCKRHQPNTQKSIQVTLCNDSEGALSQATKELQNYTLHYRFWELTQDEITFISNQSQKGKLAPQNKTTLREQSFQITNYLKDLVKSSTKTFVQIFTNHKYGVWHVKIRGFKDHVNNAMSKIKTWLDDNVQTEVQLSISKVMLMFLRRKGSSDIKKLEKTHSIKITCFPPIARKNANEEQDDDNHHCLKLIGSTSRINTAKLSVENFLESLVEQEKHFSCQSWDITKSISQVIRERLKKLNGSDDYDAIGWIKSYTIAEKRDIMPKITLSSVGLNEEAVDDVLEQCQHIVEGYLVWKPSTDEYHAVKNALLLKKTPSIDEFRQQWDVDIRLDRETSTIIIPARSKMIADDIKEALLDLGKDNKVRMTRISEFIHISKSARGFVDQSIRSLLAEAKTRRIFIEFKNPHGITLHGPSDIVNELKQNINSNINTLQTQIITQQLSLSSIESDFMRSNKYEHTKHIERETKTIIRDVKIDTASSPSTASSNDTSTTVTTVMNIRCQTIVVEKGDITKVRNVDAIINAANGPLYHAGGVDKAIADAAGPALDQECKQIIAKNNGLPIPSGKAVKTTAGNLSCKYVIHAIGPQYIDGNQQERPLLFSSIMKSLQLAEKKGCRSVAMPAISSKTYGFPLADCTSIVVRAIKQFFADYPQSTMNKVILLDLDDTACNSFAREVVIDHSNTTLDNDNDDLKNYELPPLTAKWCWENDDGEKLYTDNDMRTIETAFQQYLKTFTESDLKITPDNLKSGTIVNYSIHFLPELKQTLINNPNAFNGRLICGYQIREDTRFPRDIIRYPVAVGSQQQYTQAKPVTYYPKLLDSYELQIALTKEYWTITGLTKVSVEEAQEKINTAIQSATSCEPFTVHLNKNFNEHKKVLMQIAIQQHIEITFQYESSQQLSMTLKGFEANVKDAKLKIILYVQDILKTQVQNDDELRLPEEWGDQIEEYKLVEITKNDPTFVRIENRMKETIQNITIDKIERIQNLRLWSRYAVCRRDMKKELRNMQNLQIEMELFHGTRNTLPSEVYNGDCGFDMRFCSSGMWGVGTYFAKNASYSCDGYAYNASNGKKQVFLAQVLTGHVYDCPPNENLRLPPKKNEEFSGRRYNSVSGDTRGSKVYIVYENRVAYPTYLITFNS